MNYSKPTIVEALCEFRFVQSDDWDSTLYGALWDKVKETYPKKQERKQVSISFQVSTDGNHEKPTMDESSHMIFKTDDEKSLVQLQPNVLTVNTLAPYQGWDSFKPKICEAYKNFSELGPFTLERVGLRYINRIHLSGSDSGCEGLITESLYIPKAILSHSSGYHSKVSVPIGDNRVQVQVGTEPKGVPALIMDIDSSREGVLPEPIDDLLEKLHTNLISAYEASITDKLREKMGDETCLKK